MHKLAFLVGVIAVIVIFCHCLRVNYESFDSLFGSKLLDGQFADQNASVKDFLVDNMTCHPLCCGGQMPSIDGMSSAELKRCIDSRGQAGPFVRTNYTCGNGINGVGCPCINTKAYKFLVNRGENSHSINVVEPTFLIRTTEPVPYNDQEYSSAFEKLQKTKSIFVEEPKENDLTLQRQGQNLDNLKQA